ncbi:MAG: hypothetical protein ACK5WH_05710 [Hyphomonadaceae bacterium]
MNRPKPKTAIVTGGAAGIDRACADRIAEESAKGEAKYITREESAFGGGYSAR